MTSLKPDADLKFDGRAHAHTYGFDISVPSLRGGAGVAELSLFSNDLPVSFDLGVQGYTGKREGVTVSLKAKLLL